MKKILNIGHRGAKGHKPENTLTSFRKAFNLKADGIELDVHVCKTGELIVIHDFTVDRTTNGTGTISNLSLNEIKSLQINQQFQIPTLEEVLAIADKKHLINIELKGKNTAKPVVDLIEKNILANHFSYDNFLVTSFQIEELATLNKLNPNICLGVLSQNNLPQTLAWAKEVSAKVILPHYSLLSEENIHNAHQKGYKVITWTVNDSLSIEQLKKHNIDGIITDFPEKI